ncbi:hypothetical protein ACJIZ3_015261 [Penstemon smallii]|uniref:Major facilitator superfamily (MFS) profile domain-containing protein n=1 Tax=Penstemon smallii TaxID=265156 RepID=A0ABD3RM42_9LAMI
MENWGSLTHLFMTVFLSNFAELMISPAIPDVTLAAVCPGKDECFAAIYLTGIQQAKFALITNSLKIEVDLIEQVAGVGSVIMMPLIGNLSDVYGRKLLLTIPLFLAIIPSVLLAWKRTKNFVYAFYVIRTLTSCTQGGVVAIALGYLADNVSQGKRVSAFGVLTGVMSAAFVGGTLTARLLSTSQIFQVAASISIVAAIYMTVFLKDTTRNVKALEQPFLEVAETDEDICKAPEKIGLIKNIPSPKDIFRLLKSSITFSLVAFVAFFNSLAEAGLQACLMYFLKARFHFKKDQLADVLFIAYIGATISNMLIMPIFGPLIGEETMLSLGLFAGFLNMFFDSIAWAAWVPYASAIMGGFLFLSFPALRSIVSKQVGPNEQGLAQGCILGVTAFANIISPLIFSPLSALFLSENPPFHFKGFSILCVGFAWLVGFCLSIMIKVIPVVSRYHDRNKNLHTHWLREKRKVMENWGRVSHLFVTVFLSNFAELMITPAIPDITLAAVCPGKDECSAAIYLTGIQQAVAGAGSVIMMPLIGNLSDAYGRKLLLTFPLVLSIIPYVILSWKRTANFIYAYYVIKTLTSMVTQGGVVAIALAYLADNVSQGKRVSAFGVLSGVISAAYVSGTLAARLLSTSQIFQVAAAVSMVAATYMGLFLKDTTRHDNALEQPILKVTGSDEDGCKAPEKIVLIKKIPSPKDIYRMLKSSVKFSLAAFVAFFNSLAEAGLQACLLYFLKARFQFKKDQLADVLLIAYIGATLSNVPYASASMGVFLFLSSPAGLAQGCILGVTAFANVISPLIYSPLSALFLSENPPFHFQGFSILCVGLAWLAGFFLSIFIKGLPILSRYQDMNRNHVDA